MTDSSAPRASFTTMEASTQDDWRLLSAEFSAYSRRLPDRILAHLRLLDGRSTPT